MGGIISGVLASYSASAPPLSDSDAQAFVTAAGITNTTQRNAINQLVIDYKAAGIWTKMVALYPLVGGTATTHSYNLKNSAAYQITWNGTVTHNSNGITPNGSTGYGNTGLIPSAILSVNDIHLSYYCRTNSNASFLDMGCSDGSNLTQLANYGGTQYAIISSTSYVTVTAANSSGSFSTSRTSSSNLDVYRNGSNIITNGSNSSTGLSTVFPIWLGGVNSSGSLSSPSNRNYAMFSIGSALTSTDTANKYTADQVFQTALGRNV